MCIGIPMQVLANEPGFALCEGMGERRRVETLLVGEQPPGSWLLVFLGSAREVLSEADARQIGDALQALELVMQGGMQGDGAIDHLFADLVDREPQLPDFLQPKAAGRDPGESS
jgi:hydrogenase expression/formation protein HypC